MKHQIHCDARRVLILVADVWHLAINLRDFHQMICLFLGNWLDFVVCHLFDSICGVYSAKMFVLGLCASSSCFKTNRQLYGVNWFSLILQQKWSSRARAFPFLWDLVRTEQVQIHNRNNNDSLLDFGSANMKRHVNKYLQSN